LFRIGGDDEVPLLSNVSNGSNGSDLEMAQK
jgi:hypothetical protein